MTPLGKVVRTTAFKLSAIYFAVFTLFALAFILYISYSTNMLLAEQLDRDRVAHLVIQDDVGGVRDVDDEEDREEREDRDVDRRQAEGGSADDLSERRHGSCTPPRARCGGAAG